MIETVLMVYLLIGILMTVMLSQTPYADNSWIVTTLLWPVFLLGLMGILK